jgi:hypothetical protein
MPGQRAQYMNLTTAGRGLRNRIIAGEGDWHAGPAAIISRFLVPESRSERSERKESHASRKDGGKGNSSL